MSLINDMLRDLDRRAGLPQVDRRLGGLFAAVAERPRLRVPLLPLLGLSLLVGLGGGYLLSRPEAPAADPLLQQVSEPLAASPEPAPIAAEPVEATPPARLEIVAVERSANAFSLRLRGNRALDYTIAERRPDGIVLRLDGIEEYAGNEQRVEGLSVIQMPDHTLVELSLERAADIQLYADAADNRAELVLAALYREEPAAQPVPRAAMAPVQIGSIPADHDSNAVQGAEAGPQQYAAPALPQSPLAPEAGSDQTDFAKALLQDAGIAVSSLLGTGVEQGAPMSLRPLDPAATPLRVTRGLTLEQQDRNNSQSAVQLVQGGRLLEAYEKLLTFLAQYPEAHLSRETLATVLLAQRELMQAGIVVDEGLRLAPNYAPYKKIKARLLLQEGRSGEALQLLAQVPPSLQVDKEYHELLATLYQQSGEHARAIDTYQNLLRTDSSEGRWWTALGISLEAQGQQQQALASYQQALQQSGLDASIRQYSQQRVRSLGQQ